MSEACISPAGNRYPTELLYLQSLPELGVSYHGVTYTIDANTTWNDGWAGREKVAKHFKS